jgi:hypothetical protein
MYSLADEVGVRVDVEYDKLAGRLRIVVYDFARGVRRLRTDPGNTIRVSVGKNAIAITLTISVTPGLGLLALQQVLEHPPLLHY